MMLIYDGDCGFCIRSAQWIKARLPAEVRVEPWQSLDLDKLELSHEQVRTAVWWIGNQRGHGAQAIGRALAESQGVWRIIGHLIANPPLLWLARPVYALVANNRHRLRWPSTAN